MLGFDIPRSDARQCSQSAAFVWVSVSIMLSLLQAGGAIRDPGMLQGSAGGTWPFLSTVKLRLPGSCGCRRDAITQFVADRRSGAPFPMGPGGVAGAIRKLLRHQAGGADSSLMPTRRRFPAE